MPQDIPSNISFCLQEFPLFSPSGIPSGKGLYLTAYPSSRPNTDTVYFCILLLQHIAYWIGYFCNAVHRPIVLYCKMLPCNIFLSGCQELGPDILLTLHFIMGLYCTVTVYNVIYIYTVYCTLQLHCIPYCTVILHTVLYSYTAQYKWPLAVYFIVPSLLFVGHFPTTINRYK